MSSRKTKKKKLQKKECKALLKEIKERFNLNNFSDLKFFRTKKKIHICTKACLRDPLFNLAETVGIPFARPGRKLKPTTDALQLFSSQTRKAVIKLNKKQFKALTKGESTFKVQELTNDSDGYVALSFRKRIIGCGHLHNREVKIQIPKLKRALLRRVKE